MRDSTEDILSPGQTLCGCEILGRIGAGGLGVVYKAHKKLLDKVIALKVLHPAVAEERSHVARFLREAKVAASLDHPNIVKVYDVGEEGGLYFMIMEYVEGIDLKRMVAETGPFSPRKALRIVRSVADALSHAHKKGLVHRDVKPANILMEKRGVAKLVDFGLARAQVPECEVTAPGVILGTPVYMSPEQCRGDSLDGRSDLYGLGATLYFLLSGALPFKGETPPVLLHKIIHDPPIPLDAVAPSVPKEVNALVQRLMAKLPSARYQSGAELIRAIDEILSGERKTTPIQRKKVCPVSSPPSWGRTVLLLVAACLSGWLFFTMRLQQKAEARSSPRPLRSGPAREVEAERGQPEPLSVKPLVYPETRRDPAEPLREEFEALQPLVAGVIQKLYGADETIFEDTVQDEEVRQDVRSVMAALVEADVRLTQHQTAQSRRGQAETHVSVIRNSGKPTLHFTISWRNAGGTWLLAGITRVEAQ